jgi:hypothetical protein
LYIPFHFCKYNSSPLIDTFMSRVSFSVCIAYASSLQYDFHYHFGIDWSCTVNCHFCGSVCNTYV